MGAAAASGAAAAGAGAGGAGAGQGTGRVNIVLISGFESFNVELYKRAAEQVGWGQPAGGSTGGWPGCSLGWVALGRAM